MCSSDLKLVDDTNADPVTSGSPAEQVTSGSPAEQVTSGSPAEQVTSGSPAEQVTSGSPAEQVTSGSPAEQVTSGSPAEQVTSGSPAEQVQVSSDVDNMVNIISKLQQSGGSLTGDLTYSAALIGSDSVEYCFDNEQMSKSCFRVGPGIIDMIQSQ